MCDAAESPAVDEPVAEPVTAEASVGEETAADEARAPRRPRKEKTPLEELEIGAEVEGKIRSVMTYGAFVDIGATTDGLLHVSEISNEFIKDANEKLTAGDAVTCKIKSVNLEKGQLALTCKEEAAERPRKKRADLTKYESVDPKEFTTGTVNSITDYGAFITLEEGVDGLLHISAIKEGGVSAVGSELSIGQEVQVRIVSFDKSKRRIGLSMKPYVEGEENSRQPRRDRSEGGGGGGGGTFMGGDADAQFKLSNDELEALAVEDDVEAESSFEAAFARASFVQQMKSEGKSYKSKRL